MSDGSVRKARLSRSADFERVYRHGRSAQHRLLVMYRFERPDDIRGDEETSNCRLGITVSRRLGGAVERNRLKRQVREAVAKAAVLVEGHDIVAIARPGLPEYIEAQGFDGLVEIVADLARRLGGTTASSQPSAAPDDADDITPAPLVDGSDAPLEATVGQAAPDVAPGLASADGGA